MNLQQITMELERTLRREFHRHNTPHRWADQHPILDASVDTLLDRIRDLDRNVSHPVLACLVDLAKLGDPHAAQLVTAALLKKFADKQNAKGGTWEQFPGYLYEAVITCHSTRSRCLREIIERNALRRNHKSSTMGTRDVGLTWAERIPSAAPGPDAIAVHAAARREVLALVDQIAIERRVTPATRRIVHHIAAGSHHDTVPDFAGKSPNTIRTRRRRAAQSINDQRLRAALLSVST